MRRFTYAILLALSAVAGSAQTSYPYAPDFSNTSQWDPALWNPVVFTSSATIAPNTRVVIAAFTASGSLQLPKCHAGTVIRVIDQSPAYVPGSVTSSQDAYGNWIIQHATLLVVTVQPGPGDVFLKGLPPNDGPGAYASTILHGVTEYAAVGVNSGCGWLNGGGGSPLLPQPYSW